MSGNGKPHEFERVGEVIARMFPHRDAVLTKAELAAALAISEKQVDRLDLPCTYLGPRTPRYVWRLVLETLERRAG